LRFTPPGVALGSAVLAVFTIGACSHSSTQDSSDTVNVAQNAPSFCQRLAQVPAGLQNAVTKAVAGMASANDTSVIAHAATQLKNAAKDKSAATDVRTELNSAAAVLDKITGGKSLSAADLANFTKLGRMVDAKCVRSN
jgi:hypothetical protein